MPKPSMILIVDDDKTVIDQLQMHFRRRNFEPIATANSTSIDQILDAFEVHLILLDLRMERLNGYDVLKRLHEKNIKTPVLIITAYYADEKDHLKAVGIGEEDVIEKPFRDVAKIETRINRKLNRVILPGQADSDYENEIYYDNRTKLALIDDEVEINDILKETFELRHYQVSVFIRGDEGLKHLLDNECHVAIVDMKIPRLDGDKVIQEALKAKPNLKIIPISAAYVKEMRDVLASIGFDPTKLVTKPFNLSLLVEQVKVLAAEAGTLGSSS